MGSAHHSQETTRDRLGISRGGRHIACPLFSASERSALHGAVNGNGQGSDEKRKRELLREDLFEKGKEKVYIIEFMPERRKHPFTNDFGIEIQNNKS